MATGMSRREFVERSASLAVLAGLRRLAAVRLREQRAAGSSAPSIPLARLDSPVTLPDNGIEPVASGQEPEDGTLKVLNYADYINPDTVAAFERSSARRSRSPSYDTEDKLLAEPAQRVAQDRPRHRRDHARTCPEVRRRQADPAAQPGLPAQLLATCCRACRARTTTSARKYTAPYTVYTTGIAYRRDIVDDVGLRRRRRLEAAVGPGLQGLRRASSTTRARRSRSACTTAV